MAEIEGSGFRWFGGVITWETAGFKDSRRQRGRKGPRGQGENGKIGNEFIPPLCKGF
jgi:hypothetical protein